MSTQVSFQYTIDYSGFSVSPIFSTVGYKKCTLQMFATDSTTITMFATQYPYDLFSATIPEPWVQAYQGVVGPSWVEYSFSPGILGSRAVFDISDSPQATVKIIITLQG